MRYRLFSKCTFLLTSSAIGLPQVAASKNDNPPNIIVILADDLGYGDVQALNHEGKIPTPHLDRLAQQSTVFTDAHASAAVSTPSRYSLLTGRYCWRTTKKDGVLGIYDSPLIPEDRTTIASMLRKQGYQTACIGKWHLGMNFPTTDGEPPVDTQDNYNLDFTQPITGGPVDVGFDYFWGVDVPNYPPYCFIENRHTIGIPTEFYPVRRELDCRQGRGLPNWDLSQVLPAIQQKSVDYITAAINKKQPFFLFMPLTSPHTPIAPTEEFKGKSGLNDYADFVMQTDAVIGRILNTLKKKKILDNTIIIFASDNGCAPIADFPFLKSKGHEPSYIYKGMKSDIYEGGHRIPCIIHYTNQKKRVEVSQTICLSDFMATFAELTGYRLADNEGEDSYSILPLLVNPESDTVIREATIHHSINGSFSIRKGKWKLITISYSGGWTVPTKPVAGAPKYQLYDIEKDPFEIVNLYHQYPDIAMEMENLLKKYITEGRSTPGKIQQNDIYPWRQLEWMNNYQERAEETFTMVWNKYRLPQYGLFAEHYPNEHQPDLDYFQGETKKAQETSYLWPMSGVFSSTILLAEIKPDKYTPYLDSMIIAVEKYYDDKRMPSGYQAYPVQFGKVDRYYDDNGLVGIDYIDSFNVTGNLNYLKKAKEVMTFIMSGWWDEYGGAVSWLEGHKDQKPACSNGKATVLALKIYEATNDKEYLETGKRFYDWMMKYLRDDSLNIIWNALLTGNGEIQKHAYTYNTGTMIQSAVRLYRLTSEKKYLDDARSLAEGSYRFYVKHTPQGIPYISDLPWFVVVLFRGYHELYEIDKNPKYVNAIIESANWAWVNARDNAGLIYNDWTGRKDEYSKPKWLLDESCMTELYTRVAMIKKELK